LLSDHFYNFENKDPNNAIPGTQINQEIAHEGAIARDRKRVEDSFQRADILKNHRIKLKEESAELNTRVYMVIQYI